MIYLDHDWIVNLVSSASQVLDLGCGDGTLLARLGQEKGVKGAGIDISPTCVEACIGKGVPAIEGDIDEGLHDYPTKAFDFVILCRTLHLVKNPLGVLSEALRVGKKVIISFENEAYWRKRIRYLFKGNLPTDGGTCQIPTTSHLRNFLTVAKLENLVESQGLHVEGKKFSSKFISGELHRNPNFRAKIALYLLHNNQNVVKGRNDSQTKEVACE